MMVDYLKMQENGNIGGKTIYNDSNKAIDMTHKVFLSFYNKDEWYKDRFEKIFGDLFINKSVMSGEIDTDNSTDYIKRLIQQKYIEDSSVLVVLVGPKTYCRKHVDWEISAALNYKIGGYSGLLGLCLPNHLDYGKDTFTEKNIPPRLVDNLKSKYAKFCDWTEDSGLIRRLIEEAFQDRVNNSEKIDNSRVQYKKNLCD
jgi:hypothetical protein